MMKSQQGQPNKLNIASPADIWTAVNCHQVQQVTLKTTAIEPSFIFHTLCTTLNKWQKNEGLTKTWAWHSSFEANSKVTDDRWIQSTSIIETTLLPHKNMLHTYIPSQCIQNETVLLVHCYKYIVPVNLYSQEWHTVCTSTTSLLYILVIEQSEH